MTDSKKKVALLGATSHIAKGIINNLIKSDETVLFLFAKRLDAVNAFLDGLCCPDRPVIKALNEFVTGNYDVIINCVGIGEPRKLKEKISEIFILTETFDNMALNYLSKHPNSLYINLSSGAAYGTDFSQPVEAKTPSKWDINHLTDADCYGIAKFHSEAKHRAQNNFNIVDLRIFSYFSRFIDLNSKFLVTEIISSIKEETEFVTGASDIFRDYIDPRDLTHLIIQSMKKQTINNAFDVYSQKPVGKFELLEYFKKAYNLRYRIDKKFDADGVTGAKDHYYSNSKKAGEVLGFTPRFTSIDCISEETRQILSR